MQFSTTAPGLGDYFWSDSKTSVWGDFCLNWRSLEGCGRRTLFATTSARFPDLHSPGGEQNVITANSRKGKKFKNNTQVDKYQIFPLSKSVKQNQMPQ